MALKPVGKKKPATKPPKKKAASKKPTAATAKKKPPATPPPPAVEEESAIATEEAPEEEAPQTAAAPAVRQSTEVGPADAFDMLAQDSQEQDLGFGQEDLELARIMLLQKSNDQCTPGHEDHIAGAQPGMYYHTVTKEIFDSVTVIPVHYQRIYTEWTPRDDGGGFHGTHDPHSNVVQSATPHEENNRVLVMDNGHELVETAQYFCLLVKEDGTLDPVVFSMKATHWKAARNWNTVMSRQRITHPKTGRTFTAPMFSNMYCFGSALRTEDQYSWHVPELEGHEALDFADEDALAAYAQARDLGQQAREGLVKASAEVDVSGPRDVDATVEDDDGGGGNGQLPF